MIGDILCGLDLGEDMSLRLFTRHGITLEYGQYPDRACERRFAGG